MTDNNYTKSSLYTSGVNLIADYKSTSSLSGIARSMYRTLNYLEIPVGVNHVLFDTGLPLDETATILEHRKCPESRFNLIHVHPTELHKIFQLYGSHVLDHRYNIGYWFFELPDIPPHWQSGFEHIDELWVASSFVRQSFEKVSPVPVRVMPPVLDVPTTSFMSREELGLPTDRFLFLFSFAYTGSLARKNPLGLIEAFVRAFPETENSPMLIIKGNRGGLYPTAQTVLHDAVAKHANILFIEEDMYNRKIHSLLNACDCYVSLHRSEGFGLGMAEAMYLGKPVIATGYSGNADFTKLEWSYPVDFQIADIREKHFPEQTLAASIYRVASTWAEPDFDHAVDLLRHVYDHQDEARLKGQRASTYIRQAYGFAATGQRIRERLETLDRNIVPLYTEKPVAFETYTTSSIIADWNAYRIQNDELSRRYWLFRSIPLLGLLFRLLARFSMLGKMWTKTYVIFESMNEKLKEYRLNQDDQQSQIDNLNKQIHTLTQQLEKLQVKLANLDSSDEHHSSE